MDDIDSRGGSFQVVTLPFPTCSYGQNVLKNRNMPYPEFCNLLYSLSILVPSYLLCSDCRMLLHQDGLTVIY